MLLSACRKKISTSCLTVEKVTRCPFLCSEGVQWYSERAKKGQNKNPEHFVLRNLVVIHNNAKIRQKQSFMTDFSVECFNFPLC